MESIGDIMKNMQMDGGTNTNGRKPQANRTTQVEDCRCENCGITFESEVTTYNIGGRVREFRPRECPACKDKRETEEAAERQRYLEAARAEARENWRRQSGIPEYLLASTFASFERDRHDKALKNCLKYAQGFNLADPRGYRSLILYSPQPGVGKTHLMVAIANYVMDHCEGELGIIHRPIRFEKGPNLVRRVRATYSIRHGDNYHEREEDIYNELKGIKLLLLDDVGKEKPSDFTRDLYWSVVDERVTRGLPVVITCRQPLDSLGDLMNPDTVDRLYGMTGGQVETLTGESYRRLKRVA